MRSSSTKNLKPMSLKIDYEIKNENNKESILLLFMFSRKKKNVTVSALFNLIFVRRMRIFVRGGFPQTPKKILTEKKF